MKPNSLCDGRTTLETQMAAVFADKIKVLSTDLQKILIDDMVTAFENRLNVLNKIQKNI
ncbi:MAG: hypothetical protein N3D85_02105 [Candidatus Bathyarchaeota archaeon]|nr:hypothetical protein [Candidatus Bathyarchaeota archaeon]